MPFGSIAGYSTAEWIGIIARNEHYENIRNPPKKKVTDEKRREYYWYIYYRDCAKALNVSGVNDMGLALDIMHVTNTNFNVYRSRRGRISAYLSKELVKRDIIAGLVTFDNPLRATDEVL